jgi:conjugal transfer pilus assembly protein TraW
LLLVLCATPAWSEVLGVVGQVYEISEKDALKEIEEKASKINWAKYMEGASQKAANWRPQQPVSLSRADKTDRRLVDVSYVLENDVPLPDGSGVYPKGYVINPLDMVQFPETMIVLNGEDREQLQWFKKSRYSADPSVFVLLTDGEYAKIERELKRPVYFANAQIVEKFDVRTVPAVVKQAGKKMEVTDILLEVKK